MSPINQYSYSTISPNPRRLYPQLGTVVPNHYLGIKIRRNRLKATSNKHYMCYCSCWWTSNTWCNTKRMMEGIYMDHLRDVERQAKLFDINEVIPQEYYDET